jgi:hypothetical protein
LGVPTDATGGAIVGIRSFGRRGPSSFRDMIEARLQLSESFRQTFGLSGGDEDMWEMLFEHSF